MLLQNRHANCDSLRDVAIKYRGGGGEFEGFALNLGLFSYS